MTMTNRLMRRFGVTFAALLLALVPLSFSPSGITSSVAHAAGKPNTIPALQQWTTGTGSYSFKPNSSRIVVDSGYATQLTDVGTVFADDLLQMFHHTIPVVTAASSQPGDIFLTMGTTDPALGTDGYLMNVTDHIVINGKDADGTFYGTRTVLQLLKQGYTIEAGSAKDWSAYPFRSLMIDNGRKFFTVDFMKNRIRELAYLKYNELHMHFSDNEGFRIESTVHPEIMSTEYYTKAEVTDIVNFAAKYHITVIPELDMPGHMRKILQSHQDLILTSDAGVKNTSNIDLSLPASYDLMEDLLDEFVPLFPGPYWHIGADEYLATASYSKYPQLATYATAHYGPNAVPSDTYLGFMNWADDILKAKGKTVRAWNDGIKTSVAVTVNPDILIEHWQSGHMSPQSIVNAGHQIMNANHNFMYYVTGGKKLDSAAIYQNFTENYFDNGTVAASDPNNMGASMAVWCNNPDSETEAMVETGVQNSLRALAQINWGSPPLVTSYADFLPIVLTIGNAPGYTGAAAWDYDDTNLALGMTATSSSNETSSLTAAKAVDGDERTRWSSASSDPQWLQVDLGATHSIGKVVIKWDKAYASAYQVQVSNNGTSWTTIYSTEDGNGSRDTLNDVFASGRYVRVYGTQRATTNGYSIDELQVFGRAGLEPITVQDSATGTGNDQFEYVGSWSSGSVDHWNGDAGEYYQFRFTGTKVDLIGFKDPRHGIAAISIDGGAETMVDLYAPTQYTTTYYSSPLLAQGPHIVKVRVTGTKNSAATSAIVEIDKALVKELDKTEDSVTGTGNGQFEYVGTWSSSTDHWSSTAGDYVQFRFNGSQINIIGARDPRQGIAAVSIDGGTETMVDLYAPIRYPVVYYTSPVLTPGQHTVKVRVTGTKNSASANTNIDIDKVQTN